MNKNYLVYPTKTMNITQTHTMGNHYNHNAGSPKDYPFDEACDGSSRSWFYCPCDEMKIVKMYGINASGVNTVWMTSTSPVVMPCGTEYVTIMVEHPEDDDLRNLSIGQTFKRGQKMFREGGNGANGAGTYGNHFHISCGTGQMSGGGWKKNSEGAWVLTVTGEPKKATDCFYLDGTTIKRSNGYAFQNKPSENTIATKEKSSMATKKLDNTPDNYAKKEIEWGKKNKIIEGNESGDLMLHSNLTRQDMVVMLYRYDKLK